MFRRLLPLLFCLPMKLKKNIMAKIIFTVREYGGIYISIILVKRQGSQYEKKLFTTKFIYSPVF